MIFRTVCKHDKSRDLICIFVIFAESYSEYYYCIVVYELGHTFAVLGSSSFTRKNLSYRACVIHHYKCWTSWNCFSCICNDFKRNCHWPVFKLKYISHQLDGKTSHRLNMTSNEISIIEIAWCRSLCSTSDEVALSSILSLVENLTEFYLQFELLLRPTTFIFWWKIIWITNFSKNQGTRQRKLSMDTFCKWIHTQTHSHHFQSDNDDTDHYFDD